jgi:hypothetical protein
VTLFNPAVLTRYCDCFANGEFCRPTCNCTGCHNNMLHERDRAVAIKVTIERNPLAFHPKVAKHKQGDTERRHIKGKIFYYVCMFSHKWLSCIKLGY